MGQNVAIFWGFRYCNNLNEKFLYKTGGSAVFCSSIKKMSTWMQSISRLKQQSDQPDRSFLWSFCCRNRTLQSQNRCRMKRVDLAFWPSQHFVSVSSFLDGSTTCGQHHAFTQYGPKIGPIWALTTCSQYVTFHTKLTICVKYFQRVVDQLLLSNAVPSRKCKNETNPSQFQTKNTVILKTEFPHL